MYSYVSLQASLSSLSLPFGFLFYYKKGKAALPSQLPDIEHSFPAQEPFWFLHSLTQSPQPPRVGAPAAELPQRHVKSSQPRLRLNLEEQLS